MVKLVLQFLVNEKKLGIVRNTCKGKRNNLIYFLFINYVFFSIEV